MKLNKTDERTKRKKIINDNRLSFVGYKRDKDKTIFDDKLTST